jgi:dynein heavy chain
MGFHVGDTVLNIALREQQYIMLHQSMKHMISNYRRAIDDLDPSLRELCSSKAASLKASMALGFTALNWVSLGSHDFIDKTNKELSSFVGFVRLIDKNASTIADITKTIARARLVPSEAQLFGDSRGDEGGLDLQQVYTRIETHRSEVVEGLLKQHDQIKPLLCKIEEVAVDKNTGRSPELASYYRYVEKQVYGALVTAVLEGMRSLALLLNIGDNRNASNYAPLVHIAASATPLIVLSPSLSEVNKVLEKLLMCVVETTSRSFVRWMKGTCIPCRPQRLEGQEEETICSFYDDVAANPLCVKMMLLIRTNLPNTTAHVEKSHRIFARHASLWKDERQLIVERFVKSKARTAFEFDERLKYYSNVVRDLSLYPSNANVDFVRINYDQVLADITNEAVAWTTSYSTCLHDDALSKLNEVKERIHDIRDDLAQTPATMDEFKHLLQVIHDARENSLAIEMTCMDVEERYAILQFYKINIDDSEVQSSRSLLSEWCNVVAEANEKSYEVARIKKEFATATKTECEEFLLASAEFYKRIGIEGPGAPDLSLDVALDLTTTFLAQLKTQQQQKDSIVSAMKLFGLDPVIFDGMTAATEKLNRINEIMFVYGEFKEARRSWSAALFFTQLNIEALNEGVSKFKVQHKKLPAYANSFQLYDKLGLAVVDFQKSLPLLEMLKSDSMRPRHWKKLLPSVEINPNTFTLAQLFALNLSGMAEFVEEVVSESNKEVQIEKGLEEVERNWRNEQLNLYKYLRDGVDRGQCLRGTEEITLLLEDNLMNICSMLSSKFVGPFLSEVTKWERRLSLIGETLDAWMTVQKKWLYLESIFIGSEDIKQQLPDAAKKFDTIDKAWKKTMHDTEKDRNVVKACCVEGRLEMFQELAVLLDNCQKSLSDFLDSKRNSFPRFFFISDEEMLQVLGSSDPTALQEHCLKMFDNCASLIFGRQNKVVTGMISSEGESYEFQTPSPTDGPPEFWMTDVVTEMKVSLRAIMKQAIFYYPKMARLKWIKENIGMTVNGGSKLWWTWQTEDGFKKVQKGEKYAIKNLAAMLTKQLNELVYETRNKLSSTQRKKVNTLIIIDVHARDIIDSFVRDSILDEREFAWESQLRFYWTRDQDDLFAKQCTFATPFGYEYMGLNGRLVITPLTDRCFMTLTQALSFRLGGAPAGPAGTGKTETTKDLAKAMTLYCVVFNCGDGLDYKAMGKIFSGLVQVGAWGCFDEFNRIEAPVLSVVAAQLKTIQSALVARVKQFAFEGRDIKMVDSCGFFITMNPGYAGRTELPDNLKALFRPMTMITPDLNIICENMLLSEGFDQARILAKKMVTLYSLAKEQLSKQFHYDWGLRALKSVLVMAGSLKRASLELPEDVVLMRALRDMNSPKFVFEDVPLFLGLLADLFPGLDCPRVGYPEFNKVVSATLTAENYILIDWQADKVVQLYETMLTRHTTMIVGPTGGGKSVVLNTLCQTQTNMGLHTKLTVINAKMVPLAEV